MGTAYTCAYSADAERMLYTEDCPSSCRTLRRLSIFMNFCHNQLQLLYGQSQIFKLTHSLYATGLAKSINPLDQKFTVLAAPQDIMR